MMLMERRVSRFFAFNAFFTFHIVMVQQDSILPRSDAAVDIYMTYDSDSDSYDI